MKRTFIQLKSFSKDVDAAGIRDLVESIELDILRNPECGDLVQGTGGVRKIRIRDERRGKGKRGGYRVLFLDLPHAGKTYLLVLYDKNTKNDISADERAVVKEIAAGIKKAAKET